MVYYSMFYEFTVVDLYSTVIHFLKQPMIYLKYAMVYYSMFYEITVVDLYSTVIHFLKQPMIYLKYEMVCYSMFYYMQIQKFSAKFHHLRHNKTEKRCPMTS